MPNEHPHPQEPLDNARDAATRQPCPKCGAPYANPECPDCVERQVAAEIARYGIAREEDDQ